MTRVSLARTAALLTGSALPEGARALAKSELNDFDERIEATASGPARRMRPPLTIEGTAMQMGTAQQPHWARRCRVGKLGEEQTSASSV